MLKIGLCQLASTRMDSRENGPRKGSFGNMVLKVDPRRLPACDEAGDSVVQLNCILWGLEVRRKRQEPRDEIREAGDS